MKPDRVIRLRAISTARLVGHRRPIEHQTAQRSPPRDRPPSQAHVSDPAQTNPLVKHVLTHTSLILMT
eukprot:scaffold385_cov53-Phaeocystis_antarctica.AAC.2